MFSIRRPHEPSACENLVVFPIRRPLESSACESSVVFPTRRMPWLSACQSAGPYSRRSYLCPMCLALAIRELRFLGGPSATPHEPFCPFPLGRPMGKPPWSPLSKVLIQPKGKPMPIRRPLQPSYLALPNATTPDELGSSSQGNPSAIPYPALPHAPTAGDLGQGSQGNPSATPHEFVLSHWAAQGDTTLELPVPGTHPAHWEASLKLHAPSTNPLARQNLRLF